MSDHESNYSESAEPENLAEIAYMLYEQLSGITCKVLENPTADIKVIVCHFSPTLLQTIQHHPPSSGRVRLPAARQHEPAVPTSSQIGRALGEDPNSVEEVTVQLGRQRQVHVLQASNNPRLT